MAIRDRFLKAGRGLLGAAGQALVDLSSGPESLPGGELVKANEVSIDPADQPAKSLLWDPFAIIEQLGFREKPSRINYGTLKQMAVAPIISEIINTRVNQIAAFALPARGRYDIGFRIKMRESEDEPTGAAKKWIREAERLMMTNGVVEDMRVRNNFESFLRKLSYDSLTLDQATFEVVPNRKGQPARWFAVDASTIRLADVASTYNKEDADKTIRYVQIYDGIVITEYTAAELCFGIRNPRTDIRLHGYGTSELEKLVKTVTAILWAWEYNVNAFQNASILPGILNFKGSIPDSQLKAFRRHWYLMLTGVRNAFKTPVTNAEELQWLKLKDNNRDMEYNAWFDFLIKVACGEYLIDPVEINFKYGNIGQRGGLNEQSNKEKITESKERGLRPLLRFIAGCINTHIIWPIDEDFEFEFVGLDSKTRDDQAKLNQQLVKTTRTVDELRAEDDLEPLPDGMGEVILDPVWIQWAQQKSVAAEGAGEEGEEAPDFTQMFGEEEDETQEEEPEEPKPSKGAVTKSLNRKHNGRRYLVDMEL